MLEVNPRISNVRIINTHMEISRTFSKHLELRIGCRAKTRIPKDSEAKKAILNVELTIAATENDDMKIELEADVFFEFNQIPDDYDKVMEEKCMPIAQERLFHMLDDILIIMGYKGLGLAEKVSY